MAGGCKWILSLREGLFSLVALKSLDVFISRRPLQWAFRTVILEDKEDEGTFFFLLFFCLVVVFCVMVLKIGPSPDGHSLFLSF